MDANSSMNQPREQGDNSSPTIRPDLVSVIDGAQEVLNTTVSNSPNSFTPPTQDYPPYPLQGAPLDFIPNEANPSYTPVDWMQSSFQQIPVPEFTIDLVPEPEPVLEQYPPPAPAPINYFSPAFFRAHNNLAPGNVENQFPYSSAGEPTGYSHSTNTSTHQGYASSVTTVPDNLSLYAPANFSNPPPALAPSEPSNRFECRLCDASFNSNKDLTRHQRQTKKHHSESRETHLPFICNCGHNNKRKDNYIRHLRRVSDDFLPISASARIYLLWLW